MEEKEELRAVKADGLVIDEYWWWTAASAAQFGWGISKFRRGFAGDSHLMPFKAVAVASLLVGGAASAAVASLRVFGVRSVEDAKSLGRNVRTGLGVRPRGT
ncbi:hypothetical protein MIMGU_mgv1a016923mg [Erythranthe guttata]|uniref:Uncharacterized protein n=1 Tax=Erythranthe guttata TaxID=4155 RepID=A0A022RQN8_ERYGU|nr:PREDICTED: uncharacterized protein LOC105952474 [Erythranthe guttata]EYU42364.1 hypothetical protein MIMGU_mgv1a016923mg [Erythranthe guttata]|eukprot:XP_012831489.1 PREDICTED: uncharacterized protein LOC105952474 [Erythranthe guttata]